MQPKRVDSTTTQSGDGPKAKRSKHMQPASFAFYPEDWTTVRIFDAKVSLLRSQSERAQPELIVKKTLKIEPNSANDRKPFEIRVLALLPRCNRIVHALSCVASEDPEHGIALFEYYSMGDLAVYKDRDFDRKNNKPVPESYIWRFFVQMAQALAFIHNSTGPVGGRHPILHRDVKPKNVLVVDNGTTYPSFKLHDFGCASVWQEAKQSRKSYCGTFDWQPPENPMINTIAAEVWALGACVHFLATGDKPLAGTKRDRAMQIENAKGASWIPKEYSSPGRYYAATTLRRVIPINLDTEEQKTLGILSKRTPNHQYSDELNDWMTLCLRFAPDRRPTTLELMTELTPVAMGLLRRIGGAAALTDMALKF